MQVQNSKITAPPRPLPSLKEEIRGERRPRMETFSERDPGRPRPVFGRHPASPTFRALLADVSSTGLSHLVEHRDALNALITSGREQNQPRLVGAPSSLLGRPRPGPPARGSGALRRGFLFQLLAEPAICWARAGCAGVGDLQ